MDVIETLKGFKKQMTVETLRRKNGGKEVSSDSNRCAAMQVSDWNSRRFESPKEGRNGCVERRMRGMRSGNTSPARPSTPVSDTAAEPHLSGKKIAGSRLPEVLWPSTMRTLSVSFQSDTISIAVPVSKKLKEKPVTDKISIAVSKKIREKPVADTISIAVSKKIREKPVADAISIAFSKKLGGKPVPVSHNHSHSHDILKPVDRKLTAERKRSPLKGRNSCNQSENSRPVDSLQARVIDQHRWPSRTGGGRLSSSVLTKGIYVDDNVGKLVSSSGEKSVRRLSVEGFSGPLQKAASDAAKQSVFYEDSVIVGLRMRAVDDSLLRVSDVSIRSGSLPGSHLPSPSRASKGGLSPSRTRMSTPTQTRGSSPSRIRPSTPTQTRGSSPSRSRPSSPTRQSNCTTSVLSFVADIKKGKKTNQLKDAHQLRLLYNRYLQWRFASARVDDAMYIQKIRAEQTLYNVLQANLELWDSVIMKRIDLQRLKVDLKLNLVLREQIGYLEDWSVLESDHTISVGGVIKDLEASTLRLPVTGGARVDIDSLKAAICSAFDVMQAMCSSMCAKLSKVEGLNGLVSELAELAGQERFMLNECDALLASMAAMKVREYSLRTQLIQSQQDLSRKTRYSLLWAT